MSTSPPAPAQSGITEAEAVMRLFGADPWMRFDLWATRAWEASQRAIDMAESNGPPMGDEGLDSRVMAMFHAAGVAKEFAEMVNPLIAVSGVSPDDDSSTAEQISRAISTIIDTD